MMMTPQMWSNVASVCEGQSAGDTFSVPMPCCCHQHSPTEGRALLNQFPNWNTEKKTEKILNNTEKYWTILKNTEKYWKNTEQYSKILKNIKKYWKMPWCCQPRGGFYSTSFFKLWHWLGEQCWEWGTNKYLRGQNWDKIVWHIFVHLHDVEDGAQCAVRRRNVFDLFELLTRTETFPCSLRLHKGRLKPLPLGKYDFAKGEYNRTNNTLSETISFTYDVVSDSVHKARPLC